MWNWDDYRLLTVHLVKNGTSESLIHSHFHCHSFTCLLKHTQHGLFKPATSLNWELWPKRPPGWTRVRWWRGLLRLLSAGCSFSASLTSCVYVENWVYLRDWGSGSGGALFTCSLSMELKSSPGRLLVASDPVMGRWTPGRSTESSASKQHWARLPVPRSLICCSPPTHIYIRTDSELCLHLLWCLLYLSH